jgi:ribosomal-protein-alanine N-acetyltransferase
MAYTDVFRKFPVLETERLYLREIVPEDVEIIYDIFSDPLVTRYYDVETFTRKEQAVRLIQWCANRFKYHDGIRWGIVHRQTQQLVGSCGFHNIRKRHRKAEMGYELGVDQWGKGFATEAVNRIIDFGFRHLDLNRIEAWTMLDNVNSMHVLEKAGFSKEGILRDYGYWHGGFHDALMYSLLRMEWNDRSE